jgi:glycosyltransferase involved in cell wall biosynthesis
MKIFQLVGTLGSKFGSLERYLVLLAEQCKIFGHEVFFIHESPNIVDEYTTRIFQANAKIIIIPNTYKDPFDALLSLSKAISEIKPDIVHIHFSSPIVYLLLSIKRIPQIYQTYHTGIDHPISLTTRLIRYFVEKITTRVFSVSNRVRSDEIRAGISPNHIQTLPLGLCIKDFLNSSKTSNEPIPPGLDGDTHKILITVGRFFPEKGMKYVVEAAVEIVKIRPDITWWLVGKDGPDKEESLSIVKNNGLEHRIFFLGERNDVPWLMSHSIIQVVGSLYEGLPLMVLESSCIGIPTIGTKIGGMDEAVVDGVTGILVPRKSYKQLAAATLSLIENNHKRLEMGKAAKNYVHNKYNAELFIQKLIQIYDDDHYSY